MNWLGHRFLLMHTDYQDMRNEQVFKSLYLCSSAFIRVQLYQLKITLSIPQLGDFFDFDITQWKF